jgi:hypothetical protein
VRAFSAYILASSEPRCSFGSCLGIPVKVNISSLTEATLGDGTVWLRSIYATYLRLDNKSWVQVKARNDMSLLTKAERVTYDQVSQQIQVLGIKLSPLLKGPRPRGLPTLDLKCDGSAGEFSMRKDA